MDEITVVPATAEHWDAVATLLRPSGDRGCWCLYWRLSAGDYHKVGDAEAGAVLMRQLVEATPAPGVVAYVNGAAAGWCAFGLRDSMDRLVRSRTIPKVDDTPVWSIVCFVVRSGYRRRGVARALLEGAISYARKCGAVALEAYPVDTGGARINPSAAFVGTMGLFADAGFHVVTSTLAKSGGLTRLLVRLSLDGQ